MWSGGLSVQSVLSGGGAEGLRGRGGSCLCGLVEEVVVLVSCGGGGGYVLEVIVEEVVLVMGCVVAMRRKDCGIVCDRVRYGG